MTALEFQASLTAEGTLKVPTDVATQLKDVPTFRVLLLVPNTSGTPQEEDEAWDRIAEAELFRAYSDSDSVYDDA